MGKNSSFSNNDGTSSKIETNTLSRDGESRQTDKYTFNDSDKGKSEMPKVHEFVETNYSKGTVKSGGRGENFNKKESTGGSGK